MRDAFDDKTVGAIAGRDDLAVLAAFERVFEAVELQFGLRLFTAVTLDTRGFKNGFDVGGISHTGFR